VAVSALSGHAYADGPIGLDITELIAGAASHATAGATIRGPGRWSVRLFVSSLGSLPAIEEDGLRLRSSTTVGAQLSAPLTKSTRVSLDVFNVFDRRSGDVDYFAGSRLFRQTGTFDGFLFNPAEPRGFRIGLTTRF
jgi:hypothetical protein